MSSRVLLVGEWAAPYYEPALSSALIDIGATVYPFNTADFFGGHPHQLRRGLPRWGLRAFAYRFQEYFSAGPSVSRLNAELLLQAKLLKADLVFLHRCKPVLPETVKQLVNLGCIVFAYNNDNPFTGSYRPHVWRYFRQTLRLCHHIFVYRPCDIEPAQNLGAKSISLLRSYYISDRNFALSVDPENQSDVVFVGHYENDGRAEMLEKLARSGISVRIFGPFWSKAPNFAVLQTLCGTIRMAYDDYNVALQSGRIALVFLSKINRDTYTRRCFEIPASGSFMLAEYSDDLATLFEEGLEAEYFRNYEELNNKVHYYLANASERLRVAQGGQQKVKNSQHEVHDRARQILEVLKEFKSVSKR